MKNIMIFVMFVLAIKNVQSQNKLELGISSSIIKFSDKAASVIGDRYLFQVPTLSANYRYNNSFSFGLEIAFNLVNDIGLISNSINYNSYGGFVQYHLNESNKIKPYIFLGGTMVKAQLKRTPTLNFGVGNSYWLTDNFAINTQVGYKFSEKRFESMQSHFQFTAGVLYSFDVGSLFRRKSICKVNGF